MNSGVAVDPNDHGNDAPAVSFVVIAYNEEANIEDCIRAILDQETARDVTDSDPAGRCEVVVVDDASTDATAEIVTRLAGEDPRVRLHRHVVNKGRGQARASGLSAVRGSEVAMVDADIVIPAHWLRTVRAALVDHDVAGGTPVPDGDVTHIAKRFGLRPKPCPPTIPVSGTNGLYRRSVFDRVTVDPELTEGEDVALNRAMEAAGLRLCSLADLVVDHRESKSFATSVKWLYQSGIGATRQLVRYHEIRVPDITTAGQIASLVIGLLLWRRQRRLVAFGVPTLFLAGAASAHVLTKFEPGRRWDRLVGAIGCDALFLASYFTGRIGGVAVMGRRRFDQRPPRRAAA